MNEILEEMEDEDTENDHNHEVHSNFESFMVDDFISDEVIFNNEGK